MTMARFGLGAFLALLSPFLGWGIVSAVFGKYAGTVATILFAVVGVYLVCREVWEASQRGKR